MPAGILAGRWVAWGRVLGDDWLRGGDGVFLGGALGIVAGSGGAGRCKGALIYAFA